MVQVPMQVDSILKIWILHFQGFLNKNYNLIAAKYFFTT